MYSTTKTKKPYSFCEDDFGVIFIGLAVIISSLVLVAAIASYQDDSTQCRNSNTRGFLVAAFFILPAFVLFVVLFSWSNSQDVHKAFHGCSSSLTAFYVVFFALVFFAILALGFQDSDHNCTTYQDFWVLWIFVFPLLFVFVLFSVGCNAE